jgi:hypothetical protein
MKTRRYVILALLFTAMLCGAQKSINSPQIENFISPDGTMTAVVRSTKAPEASKESRIEVRSKQGRTLASRSYMSEDGEHGQGVIKAAWTPDSQFFVYSLESSGGHQAWHTRLHFFSHNRNEIVSLDDALKDAVINPQFVVSAPASIKVELQSNQTKTVSLYDITRRLHRSVKGLPRYATDIPQPIPEQIRLPDAPKTARNIQCFRAFSESSAMVDVARKCGIPDEHQGSGIYIFLYDMDDGSVVAIGTADLKKLLYMNHIENSKSSSLLR